MRVEEGGGGGGFDERAGFCWCYNGMGYDMICVVNVLYILACWAFFWIREKTGRMEFMIAKFFSLQKRILPQCMF